MRPILGTESIASVALTRGQLRWNYTAVHPNVYLPNDGSRSILVNAEAAWLWTGRTGIIAGRAAADLHGVHVIDRTVPIDLFTKHGRSRPGVVVHYERIADDEVMMFGGLRVTTPARTALDLARWLPRDAAVILLDRLAAAADLDIGAVEPLVERHRGARGILRARDAIYLMDGGTRSPEETRLRLTLADAGLPTPLTSIRLSDGDRTAEIGMGWEQQKVGVSFYAGDGGDRLVAMWDLDRQEVVQRCGWVELQVVAMNQPVSIAHRARRALRERS